MTRRERIEEFRPRFSEMVIDELDALWAIVDGLGSGGDERLTIRAAGCKKTTAAIDAYHAEQEAWAARAAKLDDRDRP